MKNSIIKKLSGILAVTLMVTSIVGCGATKEPQTTEGTTNESASESEATNEAVESFNIKVGLAQPESHSYYKAFEMFKSEVEEKSEGQVTVEIFANSQLGSEKEMQEAVSMGNLDMTLTGVLVSYEPLLAIFELPYLFENRDQVKAFYETEEVKAVADGLKDKNIALLAFYENGFRQMTNNVKPINTPEDVKGLAMRTPENPAQMKTFEQLGAVVTPMASTELYSALQQGVVDGQENPLQNIDSNKFNEVQKHLAITNHIYNSGYVIMNNKLLESMPEELQQVVIDAAKNSETWQIDECERLDEVLLGQLEEAGMEVTKPDVKAFQTAVEPVYATFIEEYGAEAEAIINAAKGIE